MKLVIIEPLGVEKEQLLKIAEEKLSKDVEIVDRILPDQSN